jgi:hypothetical protein
LTLLLGLPAQLLGCVLVLSIKVFLELTPLGRAAAAKAEEERATRHTADGNSSLAVNATAASQLLSLSGIRCARRHNKR